MDPRSRARRDGGRVGHRRRDECKRDVVGVPALGLARLRCVTGLADGDVATAGCRDARRFVRRRALAVGLVRFVWTAARQSNLTIHPARVRRPRRPQADEQHHRHDGHGEHNSAKAGCHASTIHTLRPLAFRAIHPRRSSKRACDRLDRLQSCAKPSHRLAVSGELTVRQVPNVQIAHAAKRGRLFDLAIKLSSAATAVERNALKDGTRALARPGTHACVRGNCRIR